MRIFLFHLLKEIRGRPGTFRTATFHKILFPAAITTEPPQPEANASTLQQFEKDHQISSDLTTSSLLRRSTFPEHFSCLPLGRLDVRLCTMNCGGLERQPCVLTDLLCGEAYVECSSSSELDYGAHDHKRKSTRHQYLANPGLVPFPVLVSAVASEIDHGLEDLEPRVGHVRTSLIAASDSSSCLSVLSLEPFWRQYWRQPCHFADFLHPALYPH